MMLCLSLLFALATLVAVWAVVRWKRAEAAADYWLQHAIESERDMHEAKHELHESRRLVESLTERVAKQSELLSRKAERTD